MTRPYNDRLLEGRQFELEPSLGIRQWRARRHGQPPHRPTHIGRSGLRRPETDQRHEGPDADAIACPAVAGDRHLGASRPHRQRLLEQADQSHVVSRPGEGMKRKTRCQFAANGWRRHRRSNKWFIGVAFVGEEGVLVADYGKHVLSPSAKNSKTYKRPERSRFPEVGQGIYNGVDQRRPKPASARACATSTTRAPSSNTTCSATSPTARAKNSSGTPRVSVFTNDERSQRSCSPRPTARAGRSRSAKGGKIPGTCQR